ncbi:MAG TPA: adenylate cyclase, partial [Pseudorhizobium sp.]|nr:adenylate cyclase [Pseudorhizobium sp.]
ADARQLIDSALGVVLQKTRHEVQHEGYTWEVDLYAGVYTGLVVAEVEMDHEEERPPLPSWVGREVTGDRRFSNLVMATEDLSAELSDGLSHSA